MGFISNQKYTNAIVHERENLVDIDLAGADS